MTIAILAEASMRNEILNKGFLPETSVIWADSVSSLLMVEADAYFDLKFEHDTIRTQRLGTAAPVFVNAVAETLTDLQNENLIRINAWPGMIGRGLTEYACTEAAAQPTMEVFRKMGWKSVRVADVPGFVTPAVIAGIINEAFFAWGEGVATKEEIDLAMKAGTNYPLGPFGWAGEIGLMNVLALLKAISKKNHLEIAPALINAAAKGTI